jgi:hypothetical protein
MPPAADPTAGRRSYFENVKKIFGDHKVKYGTGTRGGWLCGCVVAADALPAGPA